MMDEMEHITCMLILIVYSWILDRLDEMGHITCMLILIVHSQKKLILLKNWPIKFFLDIIHIFLPYSNKQISIILYDYLYEKMQDWKLVDRNISDLNKLLKPTATPKKRVRQH